jgi:hypothetical protein
MIASQSAFALIVLSVAHVVITGTLAGITVTVKVHSDPPAELQVTTVTPPGNVLPDGGLQVTVPQVPDVVGAG